ncbi:hypothetical protein WDW37_17665, partial [Bdellovibrionota bacterium FG-1]
ATSAPGTPPGCNINDEGYCMSYTGSNYTASSIESTCTYTATETYMPAGCATTNAVGNCLFYSGASYEITYLMYSPKYTTASAKSYCSSIGGTWKTNAN